MEKQLTLPTATAAASVAREAVRQALAEWNMPACLDDALVVASELTTNAILHATGPIRLTLTKVGENLRIAVQDGKVESPPLPRKAGADEVHGRGLALVAAYCLRWGWTTEDAQKSVWAEIDCRGHAA